MAEGKVEKQLGLHERIFIRLRTSSPRLSLELGSGWGGQHNGVDPWIASLTSRPWGSASLPTWKGSHLTICCWISCLTIQILLPRSAGDAHFSPERCSALTYIWKLEFLEADLEIESKKSSPIPRAISACSVSWPWWWWVPYISFLGTCL